MELIVPRLYTTPPEPLGFDATVLARAFLLQRDAGNVLVSSAGSIEQEQGAIEALGGIERQILSHWHEAHPSVDWVARTFDALIHVHAADRDETAETNRVDHTFSERHTLGDDLEIIPIPGHTPGATALLWTTGEHRVLFTGDSLFQGRDGAWRAAVLPSSDRDAYVTSLETLREIDVDVLVPWIGIEGGPFFAHTDLTDARRRIGVVLDRVRAGRNE